MSNPILSTQEIKALDTFIDSFNQLDTVLETTKVNKKVAEALDEVRKAFLLLRETTYRKALIDLLVASGVDLEADANYSDTDLLMLAHTTAVGAVGVVTEAHRSGVSEEESAASDDSNESVDSSDADEVFIEAPTELVEADDVTAQETETSEPDDEKEEEAKEGIEEEPDGLEHFLAPASEEAVEDTEVPTQVETEEKAQDTEDDSPITIDRDSAKVVDDEDEKVEEHSHSQDASIDESAHRPMYEALEGEEDQEETETKPVFVSAPTTPAPPVTKPVSPFFARLSTAPTIAAPAKPRVADYGPEL